MRHRPSRTAPPAPLRAARDRCSERLSRHFGALLALAAVLALIGGLALIRPLASTSSGQATPTLAVADAAAKHTVPAADRRTAPATTPGTARAAGAGKGAPGRAGGQQAVAQPAGTPNANCTLSVPADPTSATGLATPYRLTATDPGAGPCHEANTDQSAFVEAAIYDPGAHAVSVYHPVVVDGQDRPALPPVRVQVAAGAVVGVWFGFNGDTLTLAGPGAAQCVNGLPGSPFGQFAYCNADAFFSAAGADAQLAVPDLGTGRDGLPCPTTRDFSVVDQDQSDNLATVYRVVNGRIAQDTRASQKGTKLTNGSDEGLVAKAVDPALGCTPFEAPDLTNGGAPTQALALNELSAAAHQAAPAALVPLSDPMVQVDGAASPRKTDLYRRGVDQPVLADDPGQSPTEYCADITSAAPARLAKDAALLGAAPAPAAGSPDLLTFLQDRLKATLVNLHCTRTRAPAATPAGATPAAGKQRGGAPAAQHPGTSPAATPSGTAPAATQAAAPGQQSTATGTNGSTTAATTPTTSPSPAAATSSSPAGRSTPNG